MHILRLILTVVTLTIWCGNVLADEYTAGDNCGGAGQPGSGAGHTVNTATNITYLYCNGTIWVESIKVAANRPSGIRSTTISGVSIESQPFGMLFIGSPATGTNWNLVVGYGVSVNSDFATAIDHSTSSTQYSVAVGNSAKSPGVNNSVLGSHAGSDSPNSRRNIFIGRYAGSNLNGSDNIVIRTTTVAPTSEVRSNFLNIGNTIFGNMAGSATDDTGTAKIGINKVSPSVALDVIGDIHYTGIALDVSDRAMKDDIRALDQSLDKIRWLSGVSFVMKDDANRERELGLIAQDVEPVYPELVKTHDGIRSLNYQGMIAPLIEAVKELDARNAALEAENTELHSMLIAISERLSALERKDEEPPIGQDP